MSDPLKGTRGRFSVTPEHTISVRIELKETSQAIVLMAKNTYTKGPLYCVSTDKGVQKFPLDNIWRITEDYGPMVPDPKGGTDG